MKEIYFEYNPFTLDFVVKDNGEKFDPESKIYEYINGKKRLQFWLNELIPILYEKTNDNFNLTFRGTVLDYEDLQLEVEHFNNENKTNITLVHKQVRSVDDRLKELKNIFQYMIDTAPFEELKEKKVIEQFNEAIGNEFELAVIATMSSGKSTLLNSFLGRELMPSKNEACTATIVRIKDVDGMKNVSALCLDENEKIIIDKVSNVTVEDMREFNDNEKVSYIDVNLDIPFVSSHNLELVLLDTPGPNNSRDERHKEKTYKVINESDPLVLYVLNATQLGINDDHSLLDSVAKAMEKTGKQAKDRFIFVVNRLDDFDIENGDSIKKTYNDVDSYLKQHKIENPNIYLVSAKMAMVIRLKKNNYEIKRGYEAFLNSKKYLFEEYEDFHLSNYAGLSKSGQSQIKDMLDSAETNLDEVLVHTGIPAVEIAINDYLEKYAMAEKIKKAVDSFIYHIKEKDIANKIADALLDNEAKLIEFNEKISKVNKQLADAERGKKYRSKINNLDISDRLNNIINDMIGEYGDKINSSSLLLVGEITSNKKLKEFSSFLNSKKGKATIFGASGLLGVGVAATIGLASVPFGGVVFLPALGMFVSSSLFTGTMAGAGIATAATTAAITTGIATAATTAAITTGIGKALNIDIQDKDFIMNRKEAEQYVEKFEERIRDILVQLSVNVRTELLNEVIEVGNDLIESYKNEINSLLKDLGEIGNFNIKDNSSFNFNDLMLSSMNIVHNEFESHILKKGIGFGKNAKLYDSNFFVGLRISDKFDSRAYYQEVGGRIFNNIMNSFEDFKKYIIEDVMEDLKKYFLEKIDELEKLMYKKTKLLEDMTSSRNKVENYIEENKLNKKWLEDFIKKLNSVIEL